MSIPEKQKDHDVYAEMERIFALQKAHQGETKASTAKQRKAKLQRLKEAIEAHADEIVAAVKKDTRKPEGEVKITEYLGIIGHIDRAINNLEE